MRTAFGPRAWALTAPIVAFALLLVLWEVYFRTVLWGLPAGERLYPVPSRIAEAVASNAALLAPHTLVTLGETATGFALALAVGVVLAVVIDFSSTMRSAIYPLLVVSQTVPVLALAPLLVLWFGFGLLPKVLVVALVCFFPIVVAGVDGLRATDPDLVRLFRTLGASRWSIFRLVRLPGSLPALFSGVRIAVTYSVTGAVWGEYVGAEQGLGIFMQRAQHSYQVALVFAAVVVIAAVSMGLFALVALVERLAIPWYFAARRGAAGASS